MGSRLRPPLRVVGIAGLMCGLVIGLVLPAHANESDSSGPTVDVSFLHALPEDDDFARVDVFSGDRRVFRSVAPGQLRETSLPAGSHRIRIVPAGSTAAHRLCSYLRAFVYVPTPTSLSPSTPLQAMKPP